jgi:hypothetical protein
MLSKEKGSRVRSGTDTQRQFDSFSNDVMSRMNFRASDEAVAYAFCMGLLLLILLAFAIMGGLHVIAYFALGCGFLFVLLVLPSMAMDKIFRL